MIAIICFQLFSNSTADALHFYTNTGMLSDTETTISFTRRINKLFDVLNAKKPYHGLKLDSSEFKVSHGSSILFRHEAFLGINIGCRCSV